MKTVEFNVEVCVEDAEVRGNAMCSGDDAFDREVEDHILSELKDGNIWAWSTIRVSAYIDGVEGIDYLGCCNYMDEEDFRKDAYYFDMKGCALNDLRTKMMCAIEKAEKELENERAENNKYNSFHISDYK